MNPVNNRYNAGGTCPFDSGGFWHGYIKTLPPLSSEVDKRNFFQRYRQDIQNWHRAFVDYINKNYSGFSKYIEGKEPRNDLQEIVSAKNQNLEYPNLGWTWEAHVTRNRVAEVAKLSLIYCHQNEFEDFMTWIWQNESLSFEDAQRLGDIFSDLARPANTLISQATRAENFLLELFVEV